MVKVLLMKCRYAKKIAGRMLIIPRLLTKTWKVFYVVEMSCMWIVK
jgi:hypothetical protein